MEKPEIPTSKPAQTVLKKTFIFWLGGEGRGASQTGIWCKIPTQNRLN